MATGRTAGPDDFPGWIDFYGPAGTFKTYSYSRVYNGKVPKGAFTGKIVVVGPSAFVLQDIHETPVDALMPGGEIQGNSIATVLRNLPLQVDLRGDRQPGVRGQLVEPVQAERRLPGRRLLLGAQHAEHRADLAQRLGARRLDRGQRLAGLLRPVVHQVQPHPGLHVDQRQVVAEHVVQLAGDPQPFLGRLPALLLLAAPGPARPAP